MSRRFRRRCATARLWWPVCAWPPELRNDSLLLLEERANKLPNLMTIPMMAFIMPTIFLVVGGPAVVQLLDVIGQR